MRGNRVKQIFLSAVEKEVEKNGQLASQSQRLKSRRILQAKQFFFRFFVRPEIINR